MRKLLLIAAVVLAIAGGVFYLVDGSHFAYYVGSLAVFPLLGIAFSLHARSAAKSLSEGEVPTRVPPPGGFGAPPP